MQPKTLKLLAAVLIVLACVFGLTEWRQRSTPRENHLFEKANDIRRLVLARSGKSVELVKAGDKWEMLSPVRVEADKQAIEDALEAFSKAVLSEPFSTDPKRHDSFEVTQSSGIHAQAFLQENAETPDLDIFVGKSGADYDSAFLRRAKSDDVYEGRGLSRHKLDKNLAGWASRAVASVQSGRTVSIEVRGDKYSFKLSKKGDGWRLDGGGKLSTATVSSVIQPMLDRLADFKADDVAFEDEVSSMTVRNLKKPELRLMVRYAGDSSPGNKSAERSLELTVASKDADYRHPARVKGVEKLVFRLSSWQLDPFRKKRTDFK